ncbi:glycosyltransferase family A protein [Propioniciclava soli]|uniref:Glycosyltransferase family A protein n=1 Tax=Propioniciclava soli TaxID=2775081 RepID=A0ABZ3C2L6_9ACTN
MPQLTVVVPTYRRPDLLRIALGSLRAQTYTDFVVLVCDNANDPEVKTMIGELEDSRFTYVGRPENIGLMRNAVEGFGAARTPFAAKLDDDDTWHPEFLARVMPPLLADDQLVLAFSDMRFVGPAGEHLDGAQERIDASKQLAYVPAGLIRPLAPYAIRGVVPLNATVFRRDLVDWNAVPEDTATAFDLHIVLELCGHDAAGHHVAERLVDYRLHPAADTSTGLVRQLCGSSRALAHALESGAYEGVADVESARAILNVRLARAAIGLGDAGVARRAARAALRDRPSLEALRLAVLAQLPGPLASRVVAARGQRWRRTHPDLRGQRVN